MGTPSSSVRAVASAEDQSVNHSTPATRGRASSASTPATSSSPSTTKPRCTMPSSGTTKKTTITVSGTRAATTPTTRDNEGRLTRGDLTRRSRRSTS